MSSSHIVKCAGCNIVISEVLSFIQNKLDVMDVDSLVRVCVSGFTAEDIEHAKTLLFESLPTKKRKISKRKDGKAQRDVEDMICLFRDTDPEKIPIFVARDLQKLPPVCFDHVDVTRLLKDLLMLKNDVTNIKETYLTKGDFFKSIRSNQMEENLTESSPGVEFVNKKRGAYKSQSYCNDSEPDGLQHIFLNKSTANESSEEQMNVRNCLLNVSGETRAISVSPIKYSGPKEYRPIIDCSQHNQLAAGTMTAECSLNEVNVQQCQVQQSVTVPRSANSAMHPISTPRTCTLRPTAVSNKPVELATTSHSAQAHQCVPLVHTRSVNSDLALPRNVERTTAVSAVSTGSTVTFAEIMKSSEKPKEEDWIKVSYKSKIKNKFIGNKGQGHTDTNGSFKAAEIKIPFYIYNVDKGASLNDIKKHIYDKTNVIVELIKIKMKQAKQYEAYKFDIPRHKLPTFMDVNMWPEGIAFRRYIYFDKRSTDVTLVKRN